MADRRLGDHDDDRPGRAGRASQHRRPGPACRAQRGGRPDRRRAGGRLPPVRGGRRCPRRRAVRSGRHFLRRRRPEGPGHPGREPGRAGRGRPDGPDPDATVQACHRGDQRPCGRGRAGTRALVRSAGGRGGRGPRGVLPPVGCTADRRRYRPAAPDRRPGPGAGPDPHRPGRPGGRGAGHGPGQPGGPGRGGARRGRGAGPRARRTAPGLPAQRPPVRAGEPGPRRR